MFPWAYPNFIKDKRPFSNPKESGNDIASGETREAFEIGPWGANSGRKKEKTDGISCA